MNVVSLHKRRGNEAVEALRDLLAAAEKGEVTAVAIAALAPDGSPVFAWGAGPDTNAVTLVGAIHMLGASLTATQLGEGE